MKESKRISVIVGNGFDISMLQKLESERNTTYEMFYYYYLYKRNGDITNCIIEEMKKAIGKKDNWSDIEYALNSKVIEWSGEKEKLEQLKRDLKEIQQLFSLYLNEIIDGKLITDFSDECEKSDKPLDSFSEFLGDLDEAQYKKMHFYQEIDNHYKVIFDFYNLNYTALLDNYIFLSDEKFDPEKYTTSPNNYNLYLDPNDYGGDYNHKDPYIDLLVNTYHPHGTQDIPSSLLFGTERANIPDQDIKAYSPEKKFVKSVWARCDERYAMNLDNSDLFIIYGSSIGKTDCWWWKKIIDVLNDKNAELIIYNYCSKESDRYVLDDFFENANCEDQDIINSIKERVFIIDFGSDIDKSIRFLQL